MRIIFIFLLIYFICITINLKYFILSIFNYYKIVIVSPYKISYSNQKKWQENFRFIKYFTSKLINDLNNFNYIIIIWIAHYIHLLK